MNADAAALGLYAARLLAAGRLGDDRHRPERLDLRCDGETARLDFADHSPEPVLDPASARRALVALVAEARAAPAGE